MKASSGSKRKAPTCSSCGATGHNKLACPKAIGPEEAALKAAKAAERAAARKEKDEQEQVDRLADLLVRNAIDGDPSVLSVLKGDDAMSKLLGQFRGLLETIAYEEDAEEGAEGGNAEEGDEGEGEGLEENIAAEPMEGRSETERVAEEERGLPQGAATTRRRDVCDHRARRQVARQHEGVSAFGILSNFKLWFIVNFTLVEKDAQGAWKVEVATAGPYQLYDLKTKEMHSDARELMSHVCYLLIPSMQKEPRKAWEDISRLFHVYHHSRAGEVVDKMDNIDHEKLRLKEEMKKMTSG
ncbi:hypothetical protein KFL_003850130 [Klebsormidium nitens]|uniref:Uncharacterized protein n=1 Tax=Klebsormidium nitens TaxID=105231 RepID=A0A1Y1IBF2_KLENI|nr:hypothetical protein KFL_003850130 [Klebsormidium nitens]|eukprot:GAQ87893.1 hypothetical protein KFL_003850130 [Klebsormidium nitens]